MQKMKDSASAAKSTRARECCENVKLSLFVENPDNPSVATDEDITRLAGKLKRVPLGLTAMRIAYVTDAIEGKRMVISGNKRLRVLKQAYGEDGEVPSEWFADVTAMSEAERHEFIVTANVSDGEWDVDRLLAQYDKSELGELMKGEDLEKLLDGIEGAEVEGETDADAVPEVPEEPKSKRGAVYQLGRHRVMCGDSTSKEDVSKLFNGERADIMFTSPPYSDMREYNGGKDLSVGNLQKFISVWSDFTDYECVNLGIQRKESEIVQYWDGYIQVAHDCGLKLLAWNVWDKGSAGSVAQQTAMFPLRHEWIFVFGEKPTKLNRTWVKKTGEKKSKETTRRQADGTMKSSSVGDTSHRLKWMESVCSCNVESSKANRLHPATFPVALPSEYIKSMTDENERVCEPFGGSGTTIIACETLNRIGYAMELDEHFCDVIRRRWAEFVHGEGCDWESLTPEITDAEDAD